ncbi:MAG: AI-2E family transporter [Proteobacteria bacterium]|nr:AI-2E family transporter [Pseudomonadota bacterium]
MTAMTRRRIFFLTASAAAFWVLMPLLAGILLGAALAFLSEPLNLRLNSFFSARSGSRKSAALSVLIVISLTVIFLIPFSAVVLGAVEQISKSMKSIAAGDARQMFESVSQQLKKLLSLLPVNVEPQHLTSLLIEAAQRAMTILGQGTGRWLSELPSAMFTSILALLSWGYFLISGRQLRIAVLRYLFPWPAERSLLRLTFSELFKSLVLANILVSVIQAVIIGIFLASTGVPHLLLWTSAAFFLSFIPVVGTAPVTLGGALWCWTIAGSPEKAIAMIVCAVVAGTSDNFIRPLVARGAGALDPFWMFLAMMGGLAQFGPAGFLLGPFALALAISSASVLRNSLKIRTGELQQ